MIERNKIPTGYKLGGEKCVIRMLMESGRADYMEVIIVIEDSTPSHDVETWNKGRR